MPTLISFIQHSIGSPRHSNQKRKRNKSNLNCKGFSLFAVAMILYIENPKDATKKLFPIRNEFSKVVGYKINIHIFIAFLYTNNNLSERN